jgi:hypothetical protein
MLEVNVVEKKRLQRLAGKTGWAAGLVPILGSMISPFWAALRDGPETSSESYVPVKRFRHALLWLLAFLKHRSHALKRTYYINRHRWPARICITCDASPWGGGAWLAVDGTPKEWMAIKWTSGDEEKLGLQIGSAEGQGTWEAFIILIAVRTWATCLRHERVRIRSDSECALFALNKERSPSTALNKVAREMALDLCLMNYSVDLEFVHLPALMNEWADCLSRLFQPRNPAEIPRSRP